MKKKVLLLTALASITLASVATVAAVNKSEFNDSFADEQKYEIILNHKNVVGSPVYDSDNWFYRFQIVGETKRDKEPFVSDPDYTYFSEYSGTESFVFGGDHILTLNNPNYSGNFVYIAFNFSGPGNLTKKYANCYWDGSSTVTIINLVEMYGQMTLNQSLNGHTQLIIDEIVFEYTC